ncbi:MULTISPECIES: Cof-type HAD-IIB family hydrolase [unclassified Thermotoga]|uniref:Cof-type HAD-IIB family hydrolase n=1 Tax=unclassified Thermotoga TaxID=2631113 RepID=UPI0001600F08|nr:Cof-like hydrolase [Thermotoga sp. RQ2]AIY87643.1 Cof-like hydrolase [Thermotoga sp. Cell2]KHC92574.1 Cof-like hydrolase [Thermotoga sp. TBGT1765]KHC93545.1 Cof-like hydrolase [Thermotoga sp. TBGT1766]KHC96412.1 Cof-like hydrolase [Thermotoga sp. Xyl54]HAA81793.1 Cof-type HAD-IIB family hydrolase [Thermotoga petrophila]
MYRVFVFDLDGTLLNDSLEISEKDRKVIERLSRNCHVVFASGRMLVSTLNVEKKYFGRTFPTIAYNGAMVYIPEEGVILNEKIPPEVAKDIVEYVKQFNVHWQAYIDDVLYSEKDNEEIRGYAKHSSVEYRVEPKLLELVSKVGTTKILLIDTPEKLDELKKILLEKFNNVVKVFKSFPTYLEIVPENVDKGKALRFLRERMGWKKEEIVVFGDNENDLFMFEEAGLRVAMGNAIDKVKEAADVVTLTNNDSGVSHVLERISTDCLDG